jgi:hypothetical protein
MRMTRLDRIFIWLLALPLFLMIFVKMFAPQVSTNEWLPAVLWVEWRWFTFVGPVWLVLRILVAVTE